MTTKFSAGQSYFDRSACDHECVFTMTVISRTAKTLRVSLHNGRTLKSLRVSEYNGVEQVKPFGSYSMCSIMSADRPIADVGGN